MTITQHREIITIAAGAGQVEGVLAMPHEPRGMVLFAHGSGSGRTSPRNNQVAGALRQFGLGTLLMDLLTGQEDRDSATRFDIDMLAGRLALALDWLGTTPAMRDLPLGLFGASTGAAAALQLAAQRPRQVGAVVARGGRPDLAGQAALADVCAPTLFIVGGLDTEVLALNRRSLDVMRCVRRLEVVPGATHLFEEAGALDQVAILAARWFHRYLRGQDQVSVR